MNGDATNGPASAETDAKLQSYRFRREREATWRELETLLGTVQGRGLRALTAEQLGRLPVLYRATLSSLSVARAISLDRNVLEYLESLCARAYFVVYGPKATVAGVFWDFFSVRFPSTVRRLRGPVVLAALFVLAGGLCGFYLTLHEPDAYYTIVDSSMAEGRTPAASREALEEMLFAGQEHDEENLAAFSGFLFTHNSAVGILCFALSAIPVVLVFWLSFTNGLMLGAMTAIHHERDLALEWWSWILPHGVTELLAIVLCAGAGLAVGRGILFPGPYTRRAAMARQGREAAMLVMGAIAMLFIAALIEGIFRQRVQDMTIRYSVAVGTALVWIVYFGRVGRRADAAAQGPGATAEGLTP